MADSLLQEVVCIHNRELCHVVYGARSKSNLSLYCTADSATVAPVEQQSIAVLHNRQSHCSTGRTAVYGCTAHKTVTM